MAYYWPDVHTALTSAALLGRGDVAMGISHTGTTGDVIEVLERGPGPGCDHGRADQLPAVADRRGRRPRADHRGPRDGAGP